MIVRFICFAFVIALTLLETESAQAAGRHVYYIDGSLFCLRDDNTTDTWPSENVLVQTVDNIAGPVFTDASGYYRITVSKQYLNRDIRLRFKSITFAQPLDYKPDSAKFMSLDNMDWLLSGDKYQWPKVVLQASCETVVASGREVDQYRQQAVFSSPTAPKTGGLISTGGGGLFKMLALLGTSAAGPGTGVPIGITIEDIEITRSTDPDFQYGQLLSYSLHSLSQNVGFNVSPNRDYTEAVFWNPAAMTSNQLASVSLATDYSDFIRSTITLPFGQGWAAGFGFLRLKQESKRSSVYGPADDVISTGYGNTESALYAALAKQWTLRTSVGVTVKTLHQAVDEPDFVRITTKTFEDGSQKEEIKLIKRELNIREFDLDMGLSHHISRSVKVGVNLMNLGGAKIHSKTQGRAQQVSLRSLGLGAVYLLDRFNFGLDVIINEDEDNGLAAGVDVIPMNDLRLNLGYSTLFNSTTAGVRFHSFKAMYSHSEWLGDKGLAGFVIEF